MIVYVKCTFTIPVELPDNYSDEEVHFLIEEDCCPGTGPVWSALRDLIEKSEEEHFCWACINEGENKVVEIQRNH
jgi:hypothetical protein